MIKTIVSFFSCVTLVIGQVHSLKADDSILIEEMIVVLIDAVDVPASQNGVIAEISVQEGDAVKESAQLGKLDDRESKLKEMLARTQLSIAIENAGNGLAEDLAKKKLEEQRQLAKEHEYKMEIANRKADNEVRVLASRKAERVAMNELERATQARQEFIDSVSESEIDNLRLSFERTSLETEQADFERRLDALQAKAEAEAASGHQLGVERLNIEVEQAVADQRVQSLQVDLQRQQSKLAALAVEQQKILAPMDGIVVERFRNRGDWVNAGDPVIRVIRLDRLRAEGFVSSDQMNLLRIQQEVKLTIDRGSDGKLERVGEVAFISPEIDPINGEVRVWVEFDNPRLDVLPGMRLSLDLLK